MRSSLVQSEELQLLSSLGRDAAEILWEMAALQEETNATKEMLEKGELLQVLAAFVCHYLLLSRVFTSISWRHYVGPTSWHDWGLQGRR